MLLSSISLALTRLGQRLGRWTPANLFTTGDGFWYDFKPLTLLKQDSAGTTPVTAANDPVGLVLDQSGDARNALQATSTARPLVKSSGSNYYVQFDKVDDRLLVTVPPGGWTGTMIHSTVAGTISYAATLPAGSFAIGTNRTDTFYAPDNRLAGQIFIDSVLSDSDAGKVKDYFVNRGGGPKDAGAYAGVTDFFAAWYGCSSMTGPFPLIDTSSGTNFAYAWYYCSSMTGPFPLIDTSNGTNFAYAWSGCSSMTGPFPLIDTSSGTNFAYAWYNCSSMTGPFPLIDTSSGTNFYATWASCSSMTGPFPLIDTSSGTSFYAAWYDCSSMTGPFPLIDTSSGTNFAYAWSGCSSLTSFPAGMFDACPATNFTNAFTGCALNQTSIDNILVSIAAAGTSGGTLNMTGGTNATPSATGLAAKATLVGRGWTVTHN